MTSHNQLSYGPKQPQGAALAAVQHPTLHGVSESPKAKAGQHLPRVFQLWHSRADADATRRDSTGPLDCPTYQVTLMWPL